VDGLPEVLALVSAIGGHDYVEAAFLNARGEVLNLGDADRPLLEQLPEDVDLTHAYSFDVEIDGVQVAAVAQPFRVERRGTLVVLIGTNLELIPWNEVVARFIWAIALGVMLAALL
jgi:hypothetical protein